MKITADLHLHSKYSRATSRQMELPIMAKWARWKGIDILATGDWTHPLWFAGLKRDLEEAAPGLYVLKEEKNHPRPVYFILSVEISCIFSQGGRGRRIHLVVLVPSLEAAEKINQKLGTLGNLYSDGRPILGLSAEDLTRIILDLEPGALIIPAHIWTPWFSMFGSASGFNSVEECFGELSKNIYAIETGLSSDPPMNWRISNLDRMSVISCSDAHSPANLMREATVFEMEKPSYSALTNALKLQIPNSKFQTNLNNQNSQPKAGPPKHALGVEDARPPRLPSGMSGAEVPCPVSAEAEKLLYTIEFYPEEGKYHYDGHRECGVRLNPEETKKYQGLCPQCGRPVTVGVMNRVEELADRPAGEKGENARPYKSLVSLTQIIGESLEVGKNSKKVEEKYQELVSHFQSELDILTNVSLEDLQAFAEPKIADGIRRAREGNIHIEPGYDGEYGAVKVFSENKKEQVSLF